jgi:hypothetical protein
MGRPREQPDREHRIVEEVIVDAYDSGERAMSWYYYLEGRLLMPFAASCIVKRQSSPLKVGERVNIVGMARGRMHVGGSGRRDSIEGEVGSASGAAQMRLRRRADVPSRRGLALLACARLCLLKRPCRRDNSDEAAAA